MSHLPLWSMCRDRCLASLHFPQFSGEGTFMSGSPGELGSDADTYQVVVFAKPDDPEELVELLMQTLGQNRVDARIQTRQVPGLLSERLKEWQAVALVEVLFEHGISAAMFASSEVPSLMHPSVVHHSACREDGLEIFGLDGTVVDRVLWSDLDLLSIGEIPQDAPHHTTTPKMLVVSSAGMPENTSVPTTTFHSPELWLVALHPERVFRIDARQMNYEYLDDRKTASAAVNFRHFVEDIAARSASTWFTPSTHAWLKHESQFQFQFADSDSLRQATLTSLLMRREFEREAASAAHDATSKS